MCFKKRVSKYSEKELAKKEMFAAKAEYERALANFNNVSPEFFELANRELTIAAMKFEVAMDRVQQLYREDYK